MAWIESHQELARHPKTRRAARALGIGIPQMIGHLHLLWWWSLDFADEGNLSAFDAMDIADGALWDGEPQAFVDTLAAVGFLDTAGGLYLHDWAEYAGRLVEQRKANAEKQRLWRERHKAQPSRNGDIPPPDPTPPSSDMSHNGNVTVTSSSRNGATVHNTTQHNSTEPLESTTPPLTAAAPPTERVDHFTPFFEQFWATFPGRPNPTHRPTGREPTRKALKRLPARDWDAILVGAANYATCRQAVKGYAKDPVKWLNERLWEEWQLPEPPVKEPDHEREHHGTARAERNESAWAAHFAPVGDPAHADSSGRGSPPGRPPDPRRVIALPARVG